MPCIRNLFSGVVFTPGFELLFCSNLGSIVSKAFCWSFDSFLKAIFGGMISSFSRSRIGEPLKIRAGMKSLRTLNNGVK